MFKSLLLTLSVLVFSACGSDDGPGYQEPYIPEPEDPVVVDPITDEELMNLTQETTFKYFWDYANASSGAARERYHTDNPSLNQEVVTSGGSGFGLMAILVGIERSYITRQQAVERLTKILNFFENADRFHGAWSHWINGGTGNVIPFSTKDNGGDIVETAFLCQGLICVKEYFKNGTTEEKALATKADVLWKGVEWNWYTQNQNVLYWHWSPNYAFEINLKLTGYNETMIAYIIGAASPNNAIPKEAFHEGWARNGAIKSSEAQYGYPLILDHVGTGTGPLFWAHYSYLGLNPKNLSDQYASYWNVNVNHTNINYQYCVDNPKNFVGYGADCWGLTASYTRNSDGTVGYAAHDPENDTGVISPTAAISSIPYTPQKSLAAMRYFYSKKDILFESIYKNFCRKRLWHSVFSRKGYN